MEAPDKNFYLNTVFPDAKSIFVQRCKDVQYVQGTCFVALDANVLLSPYRLGTASLDAVKIAFQKIAKEERFIIPAQAVREFAKNRCKYIFEAIQSVSDDSSIAKSPRSRSYVDLAGNTDYEKSEESIDKIDKEIKLYRKHIDKTVTSLMRRFYDSDPILDIYQASLLAFVRELDISGEKLEQFKKEMNFRYTMSIPPGFKDDKKPDQGAGDLIIWKTVLQECAGKKRDLVFVTNEEKGDWYIIGSGRRFPRIELIEEYRRISGGGSLQLVTLSDFLKGFEVGAAIVKEVARTQIKEFNPPGSGHFSKDTVEERLLEIEAEMQLLRQHVATISTDFNESLSLPWNRAAYGARAKLASLQKQYEVLKAEMAARKS